MAKRRTLTCALAGDAPLLLYCGEALLARAHDVRAVITDDAGVRRWAADHGLRLLTDDDDVAAFLKDGIDLLLDVGHHGGLAPQWVERARDAIRFHAGLLPQSAGHHPTTWALLEDAQEHGVTWHIAGGRGHGGPIVATDRFELDPDETTGELEGRCQEAGARTFDTLLKALEINRLTPRPQIGSREWHGAQRSPPGAGILDWRRPAADLARQVRALCGANHSPVAWASMAIGRDAVVVTRAQVTSSGEAASAAPGTVLRHDARALVIATGTDALQIERIWRQDGLPLDLAALPINLGEALPLPDTTALEALDQAWRPDMRLWARRLRDAEPLPLPFGELGDPSAGALLPRPGTEDVAVLLCAVVLLARAADRYHCDIGVTDAGRLSAVGDLDAWFCPYVPLKVRLDPRAPLAAQLDELGVAWREAQRSGHRRDLAARMGHRRGAVVGGVLVARVADVRRHVPPPEVQVACVFDGNAVRWWAPTAALGPLERGFSALVEAFSDADVQATRPIAQLALLSAPDRARLDAARLTMSQVSPLRVADAVFARAANAPDVAALSVGDRSMTFAQLEIATSRLARFMVESGVVRGCPLLVAVPDPLVRIVAMLASMVVGAVPGVLDPTGLETATDTHPDWLQGEAQAVVTTAAFRDALAADVPVVICLDADRAAIDAQSGETLASLARPDDPALRLPGESGQRVVLTHRAVIGVFAGVDEVIEHRGGVWLSLCDASAPATLIDTLWAMSRGFEVILTQQLPARPAAVSIAIGGSAGLRDVAQFADDAGLDGVWLIEEGLAAARLPDAAVATAAALAWTRRVPVRAITRMGMDLPRTFAVWRMVHALSSGRLEIAVAGESARRLPTVLANLAALGAQDAPTLPWTVALETRRFVAAGVAGAGVLTLQTSGAHADLSRCIARYRQAWRGAGHAGRGQVVLLTPTLVGETDSTMRNIARSALARWLRQVAGAGPAVPLDALAICGDARRAATWIADAARAGVDEVACLVDFGLPEGTWRPRIKHLVDVRAALRADGPTLPELIEAHGVTHVALPVSAARRLLTDDAALWALADVRHVILTGEPLSAELARATRDALKPAVRLTRRYAPAECGGWCATHPVLATRASDRAGLVPLGRPLAHARVEIVDARGQPVPIGAPGELCIGAVDVLPADSEDTRQLVRADDVLMRVGLRVRQTPDGILEPAPRTTIPPTAPPTPAPPLMVGVRAAEQTIAAALWQTLGQPVGDVDAEVLGLLTRPIEMVDVQAALSAALNRAVPMAILFTHRSVAALADWAEAPEAKDSTPRWRKPFRRGRRRK